MAEEGDAPDDSQKTEDPTPRKLEEARKKGQVANSREATTWLILFVGTFLIAFSGSILNAFRIQFAGYLANADQAPDLAYGAGSVFSDIIFNTFSILVFPIAILFVVAIMGPLLQVGFLFAPDIVKPDFSKVSIVKGFNRLFSQKSVIEFLKGIFKLLVVGAVSVWVIFPYLGSMDHMIGQDPAFFLGDLLGMFMRLMGAILLILFLIAAGDLVYQRMSYFEQMRMTKQEIKDEYRQSEGDPLVRAKIRQVRMEKARRRMMQAVPKSDVVITNPTHFAVALQYDPQTMEAPKLLAKGVEAVALRIRKIAAEHKIEIVENPPLARAIYDTVEVDEDIPQELYKAVAEVISFVFQKTGKMKRPVVRSPS